GVELVQKIVGKLDVGLVDFVDQHDRPLRRGECLPQRAEADVTFHVAYVTVAEAAVVETLNGVIDVQTVLRLRRRLHVPGEERYPQALGDGAGQKRLPRAGFAPDQQGTSQ